MTDQEWYLCAELAKKEGKTEATIRNWVKNGLVEKKKHFKTSYYRMRKIEVEGERWYTRLQIEEILVCSDMGLKRYIHRGMVEKTKVDGVTLFRISKEFTDDNVTAKCQEKDSNISKA